jgi:hypothetical protein
MKTESRERRAKRLAAIKRWREAQKEKPEFADTERARFATFRKNNRARIRENANAKHARVTEVLKRLSPPPEGAHSARISIVGRREITHDTTHWRGPNWKRNLQLEKEADLLMKANDLEDFHKKKRQHEKETPGHTGNLCWCGLCHCTRCQASRDRSGDTGPVRTQSE